MLTGFQLTWDSHLGRITVAKHCLTLADEKTQPFHSFPYHAGTKSRELDKTEIEKISLQKTVGPAQTIWAAPIVLHQNKMRHYTFASIPASTTMCQNETHIRYFE